MGNSEKLTPFVFVCGLPSSGNRMILKALNLAGVDGYICHGAPIKKGRGDIKKALRKILTTYYRPGKTFAVMPVRDLFYHQKSYLYRRKDWITEYATDELYENILSMVVFHRIPFRAVSYEAFVHNPKLNLLTLAEWIGLPIKEWDLSWITDENKKWETQTN